MPTKTSKWNWDSEVWTSNHSKAKLIRKYFAFNINVEILSKFKFLVLHENESAITGFEILARFVYKLASISYWTLENSKYFPRAVRVWVDEIFEQHKNPESRLNSLPMDIICIILSKSLGEWKLRDFLVAIGDNEGIFFLTILSRLCLTDFKPQSKKSYFKGGSFMSQ